MAQMQGLSFSATELLVAAAVFSLVFWVIRRASKSQVPKGLKSPPGPWGWPLIGHVLSLGKDPHLSLARLSQQYGDVLEIRLGSTPVVVLSGLDTIRQALVKQGDDFKGRPDLYSFTLITNGKSMTFNPDCGPVWAARRRLAQDALKSFSIAADPATMASCYLEEHASRQAQGLAEAFRKLTAESGCFDPYEHVVRSVGKVISAICFGKDFPQSGELVSLLTSSQDFTNGASSGNVVDFFPLLRFLPNPSLQKFKNFNNKFASFLQKTIQDHYQDFDKNNVRDVTSSLLKHAEESTASGISIPQEKIVNIVNDIFGAGFETITTAISWSLMYLVTRPDVQKKIHKELDAVVGRERLPQLSDRPQLPYLEAFILEVFRHNSFVPFTIPHRTIRDTTLNGFFIPKERCIFINQWQVNHDQKTWGDPFEFRPERFLTDGQATLNKTLSEKVMLFGLGKRRCIGEIPAKWEMFLYVSTLLHQLEFSLTPGVEPDFTPIYGLTMKYAHCPHFRAQPRSAN